MTGAQIDIFLKSLACIGVFLVLGTFLRAKVKLLQKLYLPACVIGGVIGLVLGPRMLDILPISDEIITTTSNLPGRLFGIMIAAMPMCASKLKKGEIFKRLDSITIALVITMIGALQFTIGFLVNVACSTFGWKIYAGYGTELFQGFCGGHGTAAAIGVYFEQLGQDYWEAAQGVGMTFATLGMVGGILIGVCLINIAARKGWTNYVSDPDNLPEEMKIGLYREQEGRPIAGHLTTAGGSIETFSLHLALIFVALAVGYGISYIIKTYEIPYLIYMSNWFWGLAAMYIIWPIVRALGYDRYFDAAVKSRITGTVTDFIVTAAIISMPISVIIEYWVPILITAVLGFAITVVGILVLQKHLLKEDWFEKSVGPLGMMTGDFITGVLLTRMVDPDLKSNAMSDFSIAYSLNTFYCVALAAVIYPYIVTKGALSAALFTGTHALILAVALVVFVAATKGKSAAKQ